MKKYLIIIVFLTIILFGCKDNSIEPVNDNNSDFFPNAKGNYFLYNVSVYDNSGLIQSGKRKTHFTGDTVLLLTPYQIKIDTIEFNNIQSVNISYFRKGPTGIFNYVGDIETTDFNGLIPDSLPAYSWTSEYKLIYQPLSLNQTWDVYLIQASSDLFWDFDFFKVNAEVISQDTISIVNRNTTLKKEVYKIKYQASINTNPIIRLEATAWIANGIGIMKWEGNSELINFFAGENLYPINTVVTEELYSHKVN